MAAVTETDQLKSVITDFSSFFKKKKERKNKVWWCNKTMADSELHFQILSYESTAECAAAAAADWAE